jgi:hypothetical protein
MERRNEVLDAHPRRFAFPESHLADVLDAADFNPLDVIGSRAQRPLMDGLITRKMSFGRFSRLDFVDLTGAYGGGHQEKSDNNR